MKPKQKPRGRPFVRGFDERRHFLTRLDCQKGYKAAPSRIRSRVRGLYKGRKIKPKGTRAEVWVPDEMPY